MPRLWNLDESMTMRETRERRAHTMDTLSSKAVFECGREHVTASTDPFAVWQDDKGAGTTSFVDMVQVSTDKTTTSLKANSAVAYIVHIVLLNCLRKSRRHLIDHGNKVIDFLSVSIAEQ